nr:hypothetical protein [Orientia tsutsugamushi]
MHNGVSNISSSYVAMTRHIENLQLYCNKKQLKALTVNKSAQQTK